MCACWTADPRMRLDFAAIRQQLALQLETVSDEYSYLKLDASKDYYNVSYGELKEQQGGEEEGEAGEDVEEVVEEEEGVVEEINNIEDIGKIKEEEDKGENKGESKEENKEENEEDDNRRRKKNEEKDEEERRNGRIPK